MDKQDTKERQLIQLAPNALNEFDHVSGRYDALVAAGVTPQDLLVPEFWAHQATKLRPWAEIRARAEDGTWLGYYVVLDCSRTWARVKELAVHRLTTSDVASTQASEQEVQAFMAGYKVSYTQETKWRVIRSSDRVSMQDQLQTRDSAHEWLEKFARQQVGAPPSAKLVESTPA